MSMIFERRSVRSFLPRPVEPEKLERILRAGFEAPSAHNRRPWEFILITGQKGREAIARMSPYAKMTSQAAAAIAVCGNLSPGKGTGEDDTWWIQDLSAATENILLQITGEGLGGVWLGWYPDGERVRSFSQYFGLPSHLVPFSVIALGYPAVPVKLEDRFDASRVHRERYGG